MSQPLDSPTSSIAQINEVIPWANDLHDQLKQEYVNIQKGTPLSDRPALIFHAILENCSNALDRVMYLAWEVRLKPKTQKPPKRLDYFPLSESEDAYRQALLRWGVKDLATLDPEFDTLLRKVQLFTFPEPTIQRHFKPWVNKKHVVLTDIATEIVSDSVRIGGFTMGHGHLDRGDDPGVKIRTPRGENIYSETRIVLSVEDSGLDAFWYADRMIRMTDRIMTMMGEGLGLP
jgi:hypothetical protein